ncbi:N-myc-interactor isoform X1 [Archocentrus centrarchus]|uniref:N-myc-interactor isoform X1 n=1 Tax=Archocentrus centrarchus TaxID=63155 RepID=UPI0011E9BE6F|nr:N-myc-interactor-like isoform X1 [Archocentrus centrarchus]XP_030580294.1 N-myc-interactor-like isoform X1 [Archocentrus centrarchus]
MSEVFNKQNDGLDEDRQRAAAMKELEAWKTKVEKADDIKARLVLEKLEEDEAKSKAQQEMTACVKNQGKYQDEFNQSMSTVQDEIKKIAKQNQDLLEKLKKYQAELETKRAESSKLKQKFKISAQIPDTEVNFIAENKETREEGDEDSQPIRGVFTISQRAAMHLQGGQALITFEEEKVARQILKIAKCSVSCENSSLDVKPKRITMDPAVKFEVHLDVSRKELKVSNIPQSMPEERMKDRLEISFSRPSRGGGEVEKVEYDENTGTGHITFLHPGVAENLFLRRRYQVELDSEVNMQVGPIYNYQLRKFQTFCGCSKRTILLDDIQDMVDEEDLQDHLEIHFQKPSNSGGEIESIKYIAKGKSLEAFFCEDTEEMESAAP